MTTFITRLDGVGEGPRLAVKDLIDIDGVPTTAGCRAVERTAKPAAKDAACMAGARAAGARIVGKTNLHELAALPLGINPWFGTPTNPVDADLVPGGSSSGSATAVAEDEADIAYGSDTGGSVRIPAACCGIAGLKTTHGRISLDGVWPLAPSFDTIGPMARDVAGLVAGMQLLEPGFNAAAGPATSIGRIRTDGDPVIEAAVDAALQAAGFEVVELAWDDLEPAADAWLTIYVQEIWDNNHALIAAHPEEVGADVAEIVAFGNGADSDGARAGLDQWRKSFDRVFDGVQLLALPTMPIFPPRIDSVTSTSLLPIVMEMTKHMTVFNGAGSPCTAQPIRALGSRLPASLQLVGPLNSEALLLSTAQLVESAL
ncbi:MAG TPA: amidase [Mycobacteriales bacterium]|jgi:amidase|nr:amidase [Mycobacteriales bacterium]